MARLSAKVSVVMLGPKTMSRVSAALRKSAMAARASSIIALVRRAVRKAP